MYQNDDRLMLAKHVPLTEVISRLGIEGLRRTGAELIGPCPLCGGDDRFGINANTNAFLCRQCNIKGGDQVALVQAVQGIEFREALTWLIGNENRSIDPETRDRHRREAEAKKRRDAKRAQEMRQRAINGAKETWNNAIHSNDDVVRAYLEKRGFTRDRLPEIPPVLREYDSLPYVKKVAGKAIKMHEGPAMVAAIHHDENGRWVGGAVHRTWIDLDQPKGKAVIEHNGEAQPSKLVWGSKKGGSIRLATPDGATTLVMGEGIETTLSALVAQPFENAAYWAGVDLGNMSGRMSGRNSGIPDMSDDRAFVPPEWVKRLVFIMDGDSDPKTTRAKLECGLRRAAASRPGIEVKIVNVPSGVDLNDMLGGDEQ